MSKELTRQPHADYIIMQANDMSLRFDVQDRISKEWVLVNETPCRFYESAEYRLHEREFPKTSLSESQLHKISSDTPLKKGEYYLTNVANAAIKQYILDTEKESK